MVLDLFMWSYDILFQSFFGILGGVFDMRWKENRERVRISEIFLKGGQQVCFVFEFQCVGWYEIRV